MRGFSVLGFFVGVKKPITAFVVLLLFFEAFSGVLSAVVRAVPLAEADVVVIEASPSTDGPSHTAAGSKTVFIDDLTGYAFFRASGGACQYRKTTNGGVSWGSPVSVDTQTDCIGLAVWYDQWTPGDTGSVIHIVTMDTGDDDLFYNALDTTGDTLASSTARAVEAVGSTNATYASNANRPAITKGTDGVIYVGADDATGTGTTIRQCASDCTVTENWSDAGLSFPQGNTDSWTMYMPLAGGEIMQVNRSTGNLLRYSIWNGTSWTGYQNIDALAVRGTTYDVNMAMTLNRDDHTIYLAYVTDANNFTAADHDVRTAVYSGGSWSSTTPVVTDSPRGIHQVAIARDENTGYIYLGYTARSTLGIASTADVYWHLSTTSMSTWGAENGPLNTTSGDFYGIDFNLMSDERIYATWFDNVTAVRDVFGETVVDLGPDVTVSATGTIEAVVRAETNNFYLGGTYAIGSRATRTISQLILTETGTVDAQNQLDNVRLYYETDTSAPYDCASESYDGTEAQFGATSTESFSGPNGSTTFSVSPITIASSTTLCLYPVVDVALTATDQSTIKLEIATPRQDVVVSDGLVFPTSAVGFSASTTIVNPTLTLSHYHWRNDGGSETTAASVTSGNQDTALTAVPLNSPRRLRLGVSNEGSTSSLPTNFVLEYTTAAPTCSEATAWSVLSSTTPWRMYDSPNLTNGDDTTDIATSTGGVTNENSNFVSPNGGVLDLTPTSSLYTLTPVDFLELEYSIIATSTAVEGETYCFRVSRSGAPLAAYDVIPQATIEADVTVRATGTRSVSVDANTPNFYVGGTFRVVENTSSRQLTNITFSEAGTVLADTALENVRLHYEMDVTSPYNCASESFDGGEATFGATTGTFDGPDGEITLTDSVTISTTSVFCGYVVMDVNETALNGQTISVIILSPNTDVVATGGSVGPSTPAAFSGTTTINGGILTQTGYHWRNDDGDESDATSATGAENTAITDFLVGDSIRLRFGVSNEGPTTSAPTSFQLEYAERVSTCNLASGWTPVGGSVDWDMQDSAFLTDGDDTTNIDPSLGGITDANSIFLSPNGAVRDVTGGTGTTTLLSTNFLDIEFSITSTLYTSYETSYCFRVSAGGSPLPVYDTYAELTTAEKRDFKVQRGFFFATTSTTTLLAGVDYDAPSSSDRAFVRITNIFDTGAGRSTGNSTQNSDDVTIYISDASDITTSVSFTRPPLAVSNTRVSWEIIEFVGKANTDNEMIVRGVGSVSFSTSATTSTSTVISSVVDASKVVVFITGARDRGTTVNYYAGLATSEWSSSTKQAVFRRGATGSAIADISYAVVEFVGPNWVVQRAEHRYTSSATAETEDINPVNSLARTFLHAQKRMGANTAVRNLGHAVWMSSLSTVSFQLELDALTSIEQTSVAWIIENTQQSGDAMQVQRKGASTSGGTEPLTLTVAIDTPLAATNNSSIFANGRGAGTAAATNHPRVHAGMRITSTSTFEIWRSDTGSLLTYWAEFVEWPTSNPTLRQNYYRIYVDNNQLTPTDPWPAGATNIGENIPITDSDDPLGWGEVVRVRATVRASGANVFAGNMAHKLQYGQRSTTCSAVSSWFDVGAAASSTPWRGYQATGTSDGTVLSTDPPTSGDLLISSSDIAGTLEHENPSAVSPYTLLEGSDIEYDWYLEHSGAASESDYCFRMVDADGTELDGYLHYPQIRTAGYTPVTRNWRWYSDVENSTPTVALAGENVAPTDVGQGDTLTLRVSVSETKGAPENDVRFKLQFSDDPSFASSTDVVSTSTCGVVSFWCYFDGPEPDHATISSSTLSDADQCVSGVGSGCGRVIASSDYYAGHNQLATTTQEYSFTLEQAGARVRAVYYFRLYDTLNNKVVPVGGGESYPSLLTEAPTLSFAVASVTPGTTTAGVTITTTSTPSSISFGELQFDQEYSAAHRLSVNTNATDGYQVLFYARQQLLNSYGDVIAPISATNSAPVAWLTGCPLSTSTGCVAYHTTDPTLSGGSGRFAPDDSYAGLSTSLQEVMWNPLPTPEVQDIVFRLRIAEMQPAGIYSTELVYVAVPSY